MATRTRMTASTPNLGRGEVEDAGARGETDPGSSTAGCTPPLACARFAEMPVRLEPETRLRGVKGMGPASDSEQRDAAAFYAATYSRLVSVVGVVAQSREEAEEAVQDAFVRLLGQWSKVSRYDDPEAWVRKVAFGYVSNRRRSALRGARAFRRYGPAPDVAAPSGDAVDLHRALAALPQAQRAVLVLQDLGLTTDAIAHQLGIPTGTVKSRLSRARAAVAPLLKEEAHDRAGTR